MLSSRFFNRDAQNVAIDLLGKVIRVRHDDLWLSARIIETEAYYRHDKASHASLGLTEKRKALFMPPGTIYMYYARGGDSLNISCRGAGNAVLIKSGMPYLKEATADMISVMQRLNPQQNSKEPRAISRLCAGQTLLCKSLGLSVREWDQHAFHAEHFFIEDVGDRLDKFIQTKRLGIPPGRDEHLLYRFIDHKSTDSCTSNPLRKRDWQEGQDYLVYVW